MTRLQFARRLAESRGWVDSGASDEEVIASLADNGVTAVANDFRGGDEITRAEAATMFVRAGGGEAGSTEEGLQAAFDSGIFTQIGDGNATFQDRWFAGVEAQAQADIDWSTVRSYEDWEQVVKERFPAWSWALDHPELGPILAEAAENEFTVDTFDSQLRATDWFSSRSAAERAWDLDEADPANEAEIQRQIEAEAGDIRDIAGRLGAELSDDAISALARDALRRGLSQDEITGQIVASTSSFSAGSLTAAEDQISTLAGQYMVSIDEETRRSLAGKKVTGEMTDAGLLSYVKNVASSQFPHMAELIGQGISLKEYTAPHRNLVASMLGRTVNDIDLTKEFRDVLSIGDNADVRPMTLSETEKYVRSQDAYWQGQQGQGELNSMVNGLSRALGVRR